MSWTQRLKRVFDVDIETCEHCGAGRSAVWGVAELEARLQDPDYAGAISVAGDMNYEAYEAHDAQTFDPVTDLYRRSPPSVSRPAIRPSTSPAF
jgi:hypothetical protein